MGERRWSYTTPNPHRTPVSIEVGGDAEVLAEMGGEQLWRCAFRQVYWTFPSMECQRKWKDHKDCGWVWIVKETTDG